MSQGLRVFLTLVACAPCLQLIHSADVHSKIGSCLDKDLRDVWNSSLCLARDGCTCVYTSPRLFCDSFGGIHVDLSHCGLQQLPHFATNPPLPRLLTVNLSGNMIKNLTNYSFSSAVFRYLRVLNLTHNFDCYNGFSTFPPSAFKGLDNLTTLSLSISIMADKVKCPSGNFTLGAESIESLSHSLTELHVTGSVVMSSLAKLTNLAFLNLGGPRCKLSDRSNIADLGPLNLRRISYRSCDGVHSGRDLLGGFTASYQSAEYLDVSCTSNTFMNLHCNFPPTLKVAMMDQDSRFGPYMDNGCSSMIPANGYNITAFSFSRNDLLWPDHRVPTFNNLTFPYLKNLDLSKNAHTGLTFVKNLLNFTRSGLRYLEILDISYFGNSLTNSICAHQTLSHHPWFLSSDKHKLPVEQPVENCDNYSGFSLLPQLKILISRNSQFPLSFVCEFQLNNQLNILDISEFKPNSVNCESGITGLDEIKEVIGTKMELSTCDDNSICFNLAYILNIFPKISRLKLRECENVMSFGGFSHPTLEYLNLDQLKESRQNGKSKTLFSEGNLTLDLSSAFPNLKSLSVSANNIHQVDISLPPKLRELDLSHNGINMINRSMWFVFAAHAGRLPDFILDLRGNTVTCNCKCNTTDREHVEWLLNSTFVRYDNECVGENYRTISECIEENECKGVFKLKPFINAVVAAIGATVILLVVATFLLLRRFHWRVRFWIQRTFNGQKKADNKDASARTKFYLSYCTDDGDQADLAFAICKYAQQEIQPMDIEIKSRYDINPGEYTNDMVTKYIYEADVILLLMPDDKYSLHDNSMYELQLAIRFRHIRDIHPILLTDKSNLDDISVRFPPLVAEALNAYVLPIYPASNSDKSIVTFFDSIRNFQGFNVAFQIEE